MTTPETTGMPEGMTLAKLKQEFFDTLAGYEDCGMTPMNMKNNKPEFVVEIVNVEEGMKILEAMKVIMPIQVGIPRYSQMLGAHIVTIYPEWATMRKEDVIKKSNPGNAEIT